MYDKLEEIINKLTDKQQRDLYLEILPRYTRTNIKLFNALGVRDNKGRIRLMCKQYEDIKAMYGLDYLLQAIGKLDGYIEYISKNINVRPQYKQKLRELSKGSHFKLLTSGWIWNECKSHAYTRLNNNTNNNTEDKLNKFLNE